MSTAIAGIQNNRIGTCPHGLPPGACPICSGMGGGGSAKKADFSAKAGEMSWNECAAIGAFLKAQQATKLRSQQAAQNNLIAIAQFQRNMANLSQKIADFAQRISNMPAAVSKPVMFVANKILIPLVNALKNLPQSLAKFADKLADIQDKLNAMFGELKNAAEKKISDKLKDFKKKFRSLFEIFEPTEIDDEEKIIEEEKRLFELRTFIHDLYNKLTKENEYERKSIS